MSKRIVNAACAAAVLSFSVATAQTGNTGTQTTQGNRASGAASQQEMTVTGCLARGTGAGAQNATFMLNNAQTATGGTGTAGVSRSTSTGGGVSATGTVDSATAGATGSVTTGVGATDQPSTQQAGKTRETDPSSATMPQAGRTEAARGTSGTASANISAGADATTATSYMLVAGANQNLANFVGQRVEVRGRVVSQADGASASTGAADTRSGGSTTSSAGSPSERSATMTARFQITSIRSIGGTCQ